MHSLHHINIDHGRITQLSYDTPVGLSLWSQHVLSVSADVRSRNSNSANMHIRLIGDSIVAVLYDRGIFTAHMTCVGGRCTTSSHVVFFFYHIAVM